MSTFLLVHGAFRGGWSWRRVRPGLLAAGHDVYAPSLVGCGERAGEVDRATSLDVWVEQLEALVVAEGLDDLVLVGHSMGGIVTTALAVRVPDRLRCVVHLDAAVPAPGQRALDLGPRLPSEPPRDAVVPPRPLVADPAWGLGEDLARWVNARLTATPVGPSLDPVPMVPADVVQHHVFCSGTPAGYPSTITRERLDRAGTAYDVIAAGHDAPLTAPELVVEVLLRLVPRSGASLDG